MTNSKITSQIHVSTLVASADGRYLYSTPKYYNALYRTETGTWITEYICNFEKEPLYKQDLFFDSICLNNKFIFLPRNAEHLYIYNSIDGTMKSIPKKSFSDSVGFEPISFFVTTYHDDIYLFYRKYLCVLRIDTVYDKCSSVIPMDVNIHGAFSGFIQYENGLMLLSSVSSFIYDFDCETQTGKIISINIDKGLPSRGCRSDLNIWLYYPDFNKVVKYDLLLKAEYEYQLNLETMGKYPYLFLDDDFLSIIPATGNLGIKINRTTDKIIEFSMPGADFQEQRGYYRENKGRVYCVCTYNNTMQNYQQVFYKCFLSNNMLFEHVYIPYSKTPDFAGITSEGIVLDDKVWKDNGNMINEDTVYSLKSLVNYLVNSNEDNINRDSNEDMIGKLIFDKISEEWRKIN